MPLIVDPPSGWLYGFPKILEGNYEQQLRDAGYPEDMIPMALKHSGYMGTKEELEEMKENKE